MKLKIRILIISLILGLSSCNKFLDVVPDNAPVLDQAFALRTMAERYLATCYSSLPSNLSLTGTPGIFSGDEFWLSSESTYSSYQNWSIARGNQNGDSPLLNVWDGNNGAASLWVGITNCNIFLENIMKVPDMDESEKLMWSSEVKFLRAYYHFLLIKRYGPIPIRDYNIPIYDDPGSSQLARNSVDECFDFVVREIDESTVSLMENYNTINTESGRITKLVAMAIKAEVLVYAASPLFNGNKDVEASIRNRDGKQLFNSEYSEEKWRKAVVACKEAIDLAHNLGKKLHVWTPPTNLVVQKSTQYQMNIREAFNENVGNNELLWVENTSIATSSFQGAFMIPRYIPNATNTNILGYVSATLNIVEKFYSENGVPIEEDKDFGYDRRYDIVTVPNSDINRYNLVVGAETARLNLKRENRFYGSLVFDAGRVYLLQSGGDANAYNINLKYAGSSGKVNPNNYNWTGYGSKKHYNYQNSVAGNNEFVARLFSYPIMRLANLYLYYAEALNEFSGPNEEAYKYIDTVRARVGLKGVVESWLNFSTQPNKPATKEGLRDIIKRERTSEFALEGIRFWDVLRWKDGIKEWNSPILGWDINQASAISYYRPVIVFVRAFIDRDYFWPLSLNERRRNPLLVQSGGW